MTRRIGAHLTWLASVILLVVAVPLAAQDDDAMPTPADLLPELREADDTASTMALRPQPRAVSDWDLYAGSVYANTSPLWVRAEYLLWWMRGNELPALVTSSLAGTPRAEAGVLGAPNTQILFGEDSVDGQARSGFRTALGVRLGHWFDALMETELQFEYLWLGDGQSSGDYQADTSQYGILARPFFNTELDQQDAQLISFPGVVVGGIALETTSDLRSAGALVRQGWLCGPRGRIEWLAGYRYLQLQERWSAHEQLVVTEAGGDVALGTSFDILEGLSTWNEFHGGDLGLQWWTQVGGCTLEVVSKLAIGGMARTVEYGGDTLIETPNGSSVVAPGGLLIMPTNFGRHRTCRFSTVPELTVRLRRQISRQLVLTVGYSLVVVDHAVRSGDQLDLVVNPTQFNGGPLSGPARPTVPMNDSTLWLHGLTVGLEW